MSDNSSLFLQLSQPCTHLAPGSFTRTDSLRGLSSLSFLSKFEIKQSRIAERTFSVSDRADRQWTSLLPNKYLSTTTRLP